MKRALTLKRRLDNGTHTLEIKSEDKAQPTASWVVRNQSVIKATQETLSKYKPTDLFFIDGVKEGKLIDVFQESFDDFQE